MELNVNYMITFGIHISGKDHQYQMMGKVIYIQKLNNCTMYGIQITDHYINNVQYFKPSYVFNNLEEARPSLLQDFHYIRDWIKI